MTSKLVMAGKISGERNPTTAQKEKASRSFRNSGASEPMILMESFHSTKMYGIPTGPAIIFANTVVCAMSHYMSSLTPIIKLRTQFI